MTGDMVRGSHRAAILAAAAGLALVLLLAAPGAAQAPPVQACGVTLTPSATDATFEPGGTFVYVLLVKNTGQAPISGTGPQAHTIDLAASAPPSGWAAVLESASVKIAPGATQNVKFTVTASEDRGEFHAAFLITAMVAESTCFPNDPVTATATVRGDIEEDLFGGLTDSLENNTILLILAGVGGLVILLVVLGTRRKAEVALVCPEPAKEVVPGSGTSYPILVENRHRSRETVSLFTTQPPPGWETFLPLAELSLAGGEQETVWLSVKAPRAAQSGEQVLVKVVGTPVSNPDAKTVVETMTTVVGARAAASGVRSQWDESVLAREETAEESVRGPPVAVKRRG